jgi:histone arginine demethylase JMJD6
MIHPPPPQTRTALLSPNEFKQDFTSTDTVKSTMTDASSSSTTPSPTTTSTTSSSSIYNKTGLEGLTFSKDSLVICDNYENMQWIREQSPFFGPDVAERVAAFGKEGPLRPSWERTVKRMNKCKLKHRSDFTISDWSKYRHAQTRTESILLGTENNYPVNPSIDRVRCNHLSTERFVRQYERTSTPVILTGCADHWLARTNWTFEALLKRYANTLFKCGEDDEGYKVKIKLKYFLEYLTKQQDDSPMYVFDNSFDEHPVAKQLMQDFDVPKYFREDLFSLVGEKPRPPYRWWLIGPRRSGTGVHIDPLGTSAWNTLVRGRKRWVLFPPGINKEIVKGTSLINKGEDDEAIDYFTTILPRIKHRLKNSGLPVLDFVQYPGDTIFVPGKWWHAVLNIDDTVAVTQNFCSSTNFPLVWRKTRRGRKKMAAKWLKKLDEKYPNLAAQARELNEMDRWSMQEGGRMDATTGKVEAVCQPYAVPPTTKYGEYISSGSSSSSSSSSSSDSDSSSDEDDKGDGE